MPNFVRIFFMPGSQVYGNISKNSSVLVIVYGTLRGGPVAWSSLQHFVVDYYNADLALLGPEDARNGTESLRQRAKFIWTLPEYEDWADGFMIISGGDDGWRNFCALQDEQDIQVLGGVGNCHTGASGILLAYRYFLIDKLLEHDITFSYDWIVFTRSDYCYLCSPPPLARLEHRTVHVPAGEEYFGYTDRFSLFPAGMALTVLGVTEDLVLNWSFWIRKFKYLKRRYHVVNIEMVLKSYWDLRGLPVTQFPLTAFTVKTQLDGSRHSKGVADPRLAPYGLLAKYPTEVKRASATCGPEAWREFKVRNREHEIVAQLQELM
jgi:hypothetical protein